MSAFPSEFAKKTIKNIQSRYRADQLGPNRVKYSAYEYEQDIEELLEGFFPFARISGLRLFSPANRLETEFGFEMDNLMHLRLGGTDYILIVEAKKQAIEITGGKWQVRYGVKTSCAKAQVNKHIKTLWEYLEPISRDIDLKFVAIVCCPEAKVPGIDAGHRNAELYLTEIDKLPALLDQIFHLGNSGNQPSAETLRVSQSSFLDVLRLSLPVPELGHPELSSAIRYVERCRRALDESLFKDFAPTPERWAINGSAGMGKSVLLAYAAAVLCSGYELAEFQGDLFLVKADKTFTGIAFDRDHSQGAICLMAMSSKQLENLRGWFDFFATKYQALDIDGAVRFRQPEFLLCRDAEQIASVGRRCAALLVDEAHDLPTFAANEISREHDKSEFYLLVACDRHQRLRLAGPDARIIEGIDFSRRSKRLRQIYRNSAPVYIASLALMFRWFATSGPKVIPTQAELKDCFGFDVTSLAGNGLSLSIMSDAHPANSWCHTVATFPNAETAYTALARERMGPREVLWVRFSEEDPDFDYEKLRDFTYHNCRTFDAHKLSDKYVKGQEYPVVVIEGFPGFMDRFEPGEDGQNTEDKLWSFRREIYLCASRATCFLYFVCNPRVETPELIRVKEELNALVSALSLPEEWDTGGTKKWGFFLRETSEKRTLEVFADTQVAETTEESSSVVPEPSPVLVPPPASHKGKVPPNDAEKLDTLITENPGTETGKVEPKFRTRAEARLPKKASTIRLAKPITPKTLATELGIRPFHVIKDLMTVQVFASPTQALEVRQVKQVCALHGLKFEEITTAKDSKQSVPPYEETFTAPSAPPAGYKPAVLDLISDEEEKNDSIPQPGFKRKIKIESGASVKQLATLLGVHSQEIILHATHIGFDADNRTALDEKQIIRIAARQGYAVEITTPTASPVS